jgi:transposase
VDTARLREKESTMPRRFRAPYPGEYREKILELVRTGRTPEELSREFEVTATCIRNWVKQAGLDAGERRDGITSVEKEELARLRREVAALREEKEILKKAAAWFAQESIRTPPRRSGS